MASPLTSTYTDRQAIHYFSPVYYQSNNSDLFLVATENATLCNFSPTFSDGILNIPNQSETYRSTKLIFKTTSILRVNRSAGVFARIQLSDGIINAFTPILPLDAFFRINGSLYTVPVFTPYDTHEIPYSVDIIDMTKPIAYRGSLPAQANDSTFTFIAGNNHVIIFIVSCVVILNK